MRKLLNTLYITASDAYLAKDGENLVVQRSGESDFRIPIHNIEGVVTFGYTGASPSLMHFCAERNVNLSFLNEGGKFLARIVGPVRGNVLLRREQYRIADDLERSMNINRNIITAKLYNARTVLGRGIRDHGYKIEVGRVSKALVVLESTIKKVQIAENHQALLGIEGDAAKAYFNGVDELILDGKENFYMRGRSKRPPMDRFNALLSFVYTLLAHDVTAALETVGLDPYVGFYHRDRPGRASLSMDMMEELRPFVADRFVLTMVNRKQIQVNDFFQKENGAYYLDKDSRKELLSSWQKKKGEKITHSYLQEKIEVGLIPYVQAMLMARYIRGDIDGYPPFMTQ